MKKGRPKKSAKSKEVQELPVPPAIHDREKEKPFDFGGLPDRDLKKNLGCG